MIKEIIIDGYNVMFKLDQFKRNPTKEYKGLDPRYASIPKKYLEQCFRRKDLKMERMKFIFFLWDKLKSIYGRGISIYLVFDGKENEPQSSRKYGMEIVYAPGDETADDLIRRKVKNSQGKCLVITKDKELICSLKEINTEVETEEPWIFLDNPQRTLERIEEKD